MTFADYVQLSPSRVCYQGQGSVIDRSQLPAHESKTVLPAALRAVEDYEQFKKLLNTHLFDLAAAPNDFCCFFGAVYKLSLLLLYY